MTLPAQQLAQLFDQLAAFHRPPVENWQPRKTLDFDLQIAANGDWIHEGRVIGRHNLKKLFATVLALREGDYYLVTPEVKYKIQVEEAPFQAVELSARGIGAEQQLFFRTNMDEVVMADASHPLQIHQNPHNGQPAPYVVIRDGLTAKMTRAVYYQLVELSVADAAIEHPMSATDDAVIGAYSNGEFFALA